MTTPHRFLHHLLLLAASTAPLSLAGASTLTWDTSATAGTQSTAGTWNFTSSSLWSTDGTTLVPWSSNANTASFQPAGAGNTTVTIDNSNGQVGAAGIVIGGSTGVGATWTIGGQQLQLGSGGLTDTLAGSLAISAPIQLAASQTWSSTRSSNNNGAAGIIVSGPLSGTANLIFDGRGLTNASATANANPRVTFQLGGASANSYSGTTTVTGGAVLRLDYVSGNASRLDDSSALVLAGGSLTLNGGTGVIETVGSTVVSMGANTIYAGPNGGGTTSNQIALGALTHKAGGTLDITTAVAGIASTTTQNTNGILGGWATLGSSWASGSADGSATTIVSANGTTRSTVSSWATNDNVSATGGTGTLAADLTINALRMAGSSAITADLGGHVLTISSGGILTATANDAITNGTITSGMTTGELFVHTPTVNSVAESLTIGAAIANNGGTATSLVKDGSSTLTLSGANTYTGTTYVNAGTLTVASTGSIASSSRVIVMGGATLDVTANGHTVGSGKSLSGGGAVLGNVIVGSGGAIAPAYSYLDAAGASHIETGTLTLANNLTLQNGSALTFDLGTNSDLLSLTGTSAFLTGSASAGGIALTLADAGGVAVGSTYTLMQWTGTTTLTSFDLTDFTVNGLTGTLSLDTVNDKLNFTVSAVPEPSALALGLFGLLALGYVVRRHGLGKATA